MERFIWTDGVRNEEVLQTSKGKGTSEHPTDSKGKQASWFGPMLRRMLLKKRLEGT